MLHYNAGVYEMKKESRFFFVTASIIVLNIQIIAQ